MAIIPRSQRTNLPPGGTLTPTPNLTSFARVQFAGSGERAEAVKSRGLAQIGDELARIGEFAQRANDNAERSEATVKTTSDVELELTRLKQDIQDPDLYEVEARKAIGRITSDAQKNIGFRNRKRFGAVIASITAGANKTIINERFGKIVDREKASLEGVKDANIEAMLTGGQSSTVSIANVEAKLNSMFQTGIIEQKDLIVDLRTFKVRAKTEEFLGTYKSNPQAAVDKILNDPDLLAEQKTGIIHKMTSEITKWNKELEKVAKKEMDNKMIEVSGEIDAGNIASPEALNTKMKAEGFTYKQQETLTKDLADKISGFIYDLWCHGL